MKLLFVTEFFPANEDLKFTGGVEAYSYFLVEELSKKHQVTVICRKLKNSKDTILSKRYKVIRLGQPVSRIDTAISTIPRRLFFGFLAIRASLMEEFDIIQGNNFITYFPAFVAGFLKRKPTVAWYPDVFLGKWIKLTGFLSGIIGEIIEKCSLTLPWTKIIALSESTKDKLLKNGIKKDSVETIYGGVDAEFFKNIKARKEKIFTIACISRLVNYKNLDDLVLAAKILKDKHVEFKVIIIGDGPEKNKLTNLIQSSELENYVLIKSNLPRQEVVKILKSSHLFCLPSSEEGFGLVILEAIAAKLPYIVSDIPVLREITHQGKGGLFFKENNSKDLANAIFKAISSPRLRERLTIEGQKLLKVYSWENISSQFEEVYIKLQKKVKVLMLIDAWFPHIGGGQVHVWELSKKLADQGCQIVIFTRDLGMWSEKYQGIKVIRVGGIKKFANILGRLEYLVRALWFSFQEDFDILHAHAFSPGLLAPFIKFIKRKPVVFTVHGRGIKIAGFGIKAKLLQDVVFYKIPYDLEITVAGNTLLQKTRAKKTIIIPNGVDLEKFKLAYRDRSSIHNLLYVGRLSFEKGLDLLITALKGLDRNYSLVIVGKGPLERSLRKMAKSLNVNFVGQMIGKDLIREYRKADLLILPSRTEGHPLTLFEAWASGLPVLATEVGDNKKYIKEGINGFLAKPNAQSIKYALEKILRNQVSSISKNSFETVKDFSWEKIANRTLLAYQEILR